MMLRVANVRNGIPLAPDADLSYFLSTHAHSADGYFREGAMPLRAIAHLLRGGVVEIVDASARKPIPDALVTGVGTWALVFGRAVRQYADVPWATDAMIRACWLKKHQATVRVIRRLATVYGEPDKPLRVISTVPFRWAGRAVPAGDAPESGPAIVVSAPVRATWDDRPDLIRGMVA